MACLTALFTSIAEPPELFLSKLEARLFILGQMIVTWELWARKDSWKVISLHLAAICFLLNMSTSVPNQAPDFFFLLSCSFLFIVILVVNPDKHQRSLTNPFPAPEVDYLYGIEWNKLPLFAPHLFTITDMYDSDSSSGDEDHQLIQVHLQQFDSDSSDSDSSIHEDFLDQQLDEDIPVHLVWATAG